MDAIILAGGKGTRLKEVVSDLPKPMADINGKPFLEYLLNCLCQSGVSRIVLAVGYKCEMISAYFGGTFMGHEVIYSVEDQPLGTGGALRQALDSVSSEHALVLNGDTFFDINFMQMFAQHREREADLTIGLKPMINFDRYGTVTEQDGHIIGFKEKCFCTNGLVNGGVYLMGKHLLQQMPDKRCFSFEVDFLEKKVKDLSFSAYIADKYFIDIGLPDAYRKACSDFERMFN